MSEQLDHVVDLVIGEHARDTRCPHIHGYTEAETTCPVVLDLIRMQREASRPPGTEAVE